MFSNEEVTLTKCELKRKLQEIKDRECDILIYPHQFEELKQLILNAFKFGLIDCEIYNMLLADSYLFHEMLKSSDLNDVCVASIKNASNHLLYDEIKCNTLNQFESGGLIYYIFSLHNDAIPNLVKIVSDLAKDGFPIKKSCVFKPGEQNITMKNCSITTGKEAQHYCAAKEAITHYCTEDSEHYYIEPHYLLPIKDNPHFKELKQCFKDIYDTIDSNDLDKAKDSLKQIKENVSKYNIDVDSIVKALCCLANEAKSNEAIAHAICGLAGDITYPTDHLGSVSISSNTNKEQERTH